LLAINTLHLLQEALEAGQPREGDEARQVLVEDELLCCAAWRVVERHLLTVRNQPLVSSPAGARSQVHNE
jgi:hypothetical protein